MSMKNAARVSLLTLVGSALVGAAALAGSQLWSTSPSRQAEGAATQRAVDMTAPADPIKPVGGRVPSESPLADRCVGFQQAVLPASPVFYPSRTPAEVKAGLAIDASFLHTLEDIAGVRQDSNPLRDQAVPRCAVADLLLGEPVFVRDYPKDAGSWFVPVTYQGRQVLLASVSRDTSGRGTQGGSRWGPMPPVDEATARSGLAASDDPIVSVELVFARYQGSGPPDQIAWRGVRSSGAVMYLFPGFPGSAAPGLVAPEAEVEFGY
jgi:hypothetical protein